MGCTHRNRSDRYIYFNGLDQRFCFQSNMIYLWDTFTQKNPFLLITMTDFRGDLTHISAEMATLASNSPRQTSSLPSSFRIALVFCVLQCFLFQEWLEHFWYTLIQ